MKKVKKSQEEEKEIINKVESFSKFKKARMARISGNFMKGGFQLSQNKVKAVLDNIEVLKKFANGEFDKEIDELQDDEILEL